MMIFFYIINSLVYFVWYVYFVSFLFAFSVISFKLYREHIFVPMGQQQQKQATTHTLFLSFFVFALINNKLPEIFHNIDIDIDVINTHQSNRKLGFFSNRCRLRSHFQSNENDRKNHCKLSVRCLDEFIPFTVPKCLKFYFPKCSHYYLNISIFF